MTDERRKTIQMQAIAEDISAYRHSWREAVDINQATGWTIQVRYDNEGPDSWTETSGIRPRSGVWLDSHNEGPDSWTETSGIELSDEDLKLAFKAAKLLDQGDYFSAYDSVKIKNRERETS